MKTLVLVFLSAIYFFTPISAQKYYPSSEEFEWAALDVPDNISFDCPGSLFFERGILYMNDSEAVIPVIYKNEEFGVLKILKTGKVKWETPIPGHILGTSTKNGNILVIYTPEWKGKRDMYKLIKHVHASLINAENGKLIVDKLIYQNTISKQLEARIAKRPSGEFDHINIGRK